MLSALFCTLLRFNSFMIRVSCKMNFSWKRAVVFDIFLQDCRLIFIVTFVCFLVSLEKEKYPPVMIAEKDHEGDNLRFLKDLCVQPDLKPINELYILNYSDKILAMFNTRFRMPLVKDSLWNKSMFTKIRLQF